MQEKVFDSKFMTFTFFEKYALGIPKPDCAPRKEDLLPPIKALAENYTKPFAIISDRIHNNGTDPTLYPLVEKHIPTLMLYAVVGYTLLTSQYFPIEKQFWKRVKTRLFSNREDAIAWVEAELDKLEPQNNAS